MRRTTITSAKAGSVYESTHLVSTVGLGRLVAGIWSFRATGLARVLFLGFETRSARQAHPLTDFTERTAVKERTSLFGMGKSILDVRSNL
jgi:hypothetical protein